MMVIKGRKEILSVSISSELAERLREHAKKEGEKLSRVVEKAIEDYLKDHYRGNPAFQLDKWVEDKEFVAMPTLGEKPNPELVQNMDNDMLERYVVQSYQHFELGKMEIRKRRAEGRWNKPYCW